MIPRFRLERPRSLEEALATYDAETGDAAYIAGGTELLQVMKMGLAEFEALIDLKGIEQLQGISVEQDGSLRIGSTATHRQIERSADVAAFLPALVELEHHLANQRVRNTGTLGGNLAFAEPHSDPATLLLVCDASVELAGSGGTREMDLADFTIGPLFTARDPDEILLAIRIPPRAPKEGTAYAKFKFFERPAVSVAARMRVDNGTIASASLAVGSMTEVPMRVPAAAAPLVGSSVAGADLDIALEAAAEALAALDAVDDHN